MSDETAVTETSTEKVKDTGSAAVKGSKVVITFGEMTLTLVPGTYRKVTNRVGTAHLTVRDDATLSYTNRSKEATPVTAKEFIRVYKTGLNTLHDGAKTEKPSTKDEPSSTEADLTEAELELAEA